MIASYGTLEAWTSDASRSSPGSLQKVTTYVHVTCVSLTQPEVERARYTILSTLRMVSAFSSYLGLHKPSFTAAMATNSA